MLDWNQMSLETRTPVRISPRYAALAACVVAIILYGSLYPFEFSNRGGILQAVRYLFSTPVGSADRGDSLSNVLLYIPLGLFAARALRAYPASKRIPAVALFGGALSLVIEIVQFYDYSRAPELSDVAANFSGALIGAVAEPAVRPERFPGIKWRPFAILLIACELGMWLAPFVPSLHAWHYSRALATMGNAVPFEPLAVYKQFVLWLALGALLEALAGAAFSRKALAPIAILVLAARVAIPTQSPVRADLIGAAAGVLLWTLVISRLRARVAIVAALFAAFIAIDALRPFTFLDAPRRFGWIPFASFIDGPRGSASRMFLEKTFLYGGMLWLAMETGMSRIRATLAVLALVVALRVAQMWLPDRSAEITDAAMVLILAAVMTIFEK